MFRLFITGYACAESVHYKVFFWIMKIELQRIRQLEILKLEFNHWYALLYMYKLWSNQLTRRSKVLNSEAWCIITSHLYKQDICINEHVVHFWCSLFKLKKFVGSLKSEKIGHYAISKRMAFLEEESLNVSKLTLKCPKGGGS